MTMEPLFGDVPVLASAGTGAAPDLTIVVRGIPGPQGSKTRLGHGAMVESSKKVKPWRQDVAAAARTAMELPGELLGGIQLHRPPLDGPLAVSMVFAMRERPTGKPAWWPTSGAKWSRALWWRPASTPDLSKLARSTEDALTGIAWKDDARVVEYRPLAKYYVGHDAPDVLPDGPGVVIRIWRLT